MAVPDDALGALAATQDRLLGGTVAFEQPASGYRAAIDGLLLAAFAPRSHRVAADLGAGAGMVTLALLARVRAEHVVAVESDATMAAMLRRNLASNGFESRATVLATDVLVAARARRGSVDLVVSNPPFWSHGAGTPTRDEATQRARSAAGAGALPLFLRAARTLLGRGGRICMVWPASDLEALLAHASAVGVHPKRLRCVHALPSRAAHRVLVELKPGRAGGLVLDPPLNLFDAPGVPSRECVECTGAIPT